MCSWRSGAAAMVMLACGTACAQRVGYAGIGRPATPAEISAWDIDVRPDFKGLPQGAGSVAQGMAVWEGKCVSCHGVFGESNQVFSPMVGGTTADDMKTGRVARLTDTSYPGRTTLMKLSTVSTLWDYISRAMPWAAPKSLTTDEVYAVTAYILNLGGIVPEDFVLTDRNIGEVQARLPNRDGMTRSHSMWADSATGRPDVQGKRCMSDCGPEPKVASFIPEHARNAHGNLAQQNRSVGPQRGADTTRPAPATLAEARQRAGAVEPPSVAARPPEAAAAINLAQQHSCTGCHGMDSKLVGPSFEDIARRYHGRADATAYLAGKIKAGGSGVWGDVAMPSQAMADNDARAIAAWLATGAKR
jgi:cytochrome c551/c552/mono/diheme cytochrome c family protein